MNAKLPFGFDRPEDSPGFLLWQTTVLWQRAIKKALEPHGAPHAHFVIMAVTLWYQGQGTNPTQSMIIKQTKLDKMTVSKALKQLATLGYIKRSEHETDTRAKEVSLTSPGTALIHKLAPIVEAVDEMFFGTLADSGKTTLRPLLAELVHQNDEQSVGV